MNLKLKRLVSLVAFALMFTFVSCNGADKAILETATKNIMVTSNITNLTADFDLQSTVSVFDGETFVEVPVEREITQNEYVTIDEEKSGDEELYKVTVVRPTSDKTQVELTLTATLTYNKSTAERTWKVFVQPLPKAEKVDTDGAKSSSINSTIELKGTITAIIPKAGFIVSDTKGGFYVYVGAELDTKVKVGAEVTVTGKRAVYYSLPQLTSPSIVFDKEAPAAGYDFSNAPATEIGTISSGNPDVLSNYSKMAKVTGVVVENEGPTDFALFDLKSYSYIHFYDNAANDELKEELKDLVGKNIEVVTTTYDFHSSSKVWRSVGVASTIKEVTESILTDADKVASAKAEIIAKLHKKDIVENLALTDGKIEESTSGATITWVSSKPEVISNTGKLTSPSEDTSVTMTATITSGTVTDTVEIKLTAKFVPVMTVAKVVEAMNKEQGEVVGFEGVLIGRDKSGYSFFADASGYMYIRVKLPDNEIGDKFKIVGKTTVYNGTSEYTRQVELISYTKLEGTHTDPLTPSQLTIADFQKLSGTNPLTEADIKAIVANTTLNVKEVTVTGKLIAETSGKNTNTYLEDAAGKRIFVHYNSADIVAINALADQTVTLQGVLYNYHNSNGYIFIAFSIVTPAPAA